MYQQVNTPIIGIWDTDMIVSPKQIIACVENIQNKKYALAIAHNGCVYFMNSQPSSLFRGNRDLTILSAGHLIPRYGLHTVGGAVFVDREKYLAADGENENFYGRGGEDNERVMRMEILYENIYRACLPSLSPDTK